MDAATAQLEEGSWGRMAMVMGSSVRMWKHTYAYSLRNREVQRAVTEYGSFQLLITDGSDIDSSSITHASPPSLLSSPSVKKRKLVSGSGGRIYSGLMVRSSLSLRVEDDDEVRIMGDGGSVRREGEDELVMGDDVDDDVAMYGDGDGGWACD